MRKKRPHHFDLFVDHIADLGKSERQTFNGQCTMLDRKKFCLMHDKSAHLLQRQASSAILQLRPVHG